MSSLDSPPSPWWHTAALLRGSCFGILLTLRGRTATLALSLLRGGAKLSRQTRRLSFMSGLRACSSCVQYAGMPVLSRLDATGRHQMSCGEPAVQPSSWVSAGTGCGRSLVWRLR